MSTFTHPTTNEMSGCTIGVFPKLVFIFVFLIKTVLWIEPKLPSLKCLAGAVVASWSLPQEVAGSNPFTVMTYFCH